MVQVGSDPDIEALIEGEEEPVQQVVDLADGTRLVISPSENSFMEEHEDIQYEDIPNLTQGTSSDSDCYAESV